MVRKSVRYSQYPLSYTIGWSIRPRDVIDLDRCRGALIRERPGPLLHLNDEVRVLSGDWMTTGEHHVDALAGQRQLVLDYHFDVAEAGLDEIASPHGQAG